MCGHPDNVRSKINKTNTDYVFTSLNGNKMTSGDISGRLHSLWEKAGIFENRAVPKKLCTNIIRKSESTLVRQTDKQKSQVVADSMLHSLNTAEQHYARRNIEIAAAKGGQTIRSVFKEKANPISTRKSWSKDEIKILEENFPELIVTKELKEKNTGVLSPLKASPRQICDKVQRLKREKQVMFKKRVIQSEMSF